MTSPDGVSPDGSIGVGMFAARQAETEEQAAARATEGAWQGSWNGAQENIKGGFTTTAYVAGEVGRLDNRIDEVVYGQGLAQLNTYSTSDVWTKPPNCRKVVIDIMGGASGGGCGNSSPTFSVFNYGLGGYSGGWYTIELNPLDLPDQVQVIVGSGGMGSTTEGAYGAAGSESSFHGFTATGAAPNGFGTGNKTFRIRGGRGGYRQSVGDGVVDYPGANGGAGTYADGGRGSSQVGVYGESGSGVGIQQIGMGSAGGGGYIGKGGAFDVGLTHGSGGGGGGWPSGPGGGGGGGFTYPIASNPRPGPGGSGAGGAVFVTSYLEV